MFKILLLKFLIVVFIEVAGCEIIPFDKIRIGTHDAVASIVKRKNRDIVEITTFNKGKWSGVFLHPVTSDTWDFSNIQSISIKVKNLNSRKFIAGLRIDSPGAIMTQSLEGLCNDRLFNYNYIKEEIKPFEEKVYILEIKRKVSDLPERNFFGMRGVPALPEDVLRVDAGNIMYILFFVITNSGEEGIKCNFTINEVKKEGFFQEREEIIPSITKEDFFPFIDIYGQYKHSEWEGKIICDEGFQESLKEELKDIKKWEKPSQWNKYGGWKKGPTLERTGHFYTTKHNGKWWLVDPSGKLFFSSGIDCIWYGEMTPVEEREKWFEDFPGNKEEFKEFLGREKSIIGYYKGREPLSFDFASANLKRKYNKNWKEKFSKMCLKRLRSWGINTVGNWSEREIYFGKKIPYVVDINFDARTIEGSEGYWGKFYDVFDESFYTNLCRRMNCEKDITSSDPYCIGYFIHNELNWGDETSLAVASLISPPGQRAKKVFVDHLCKKYEKIENLNKAWGEEYKTWEEFYRKTKKPDIKRAYDDLKELNDMLVDKYFKTCRYILKAVAPNKLYLGCRFGSTWVNDSVIRIASKYCDVLSFNIYSEDLNNFKLPEDIDIPVIIGEFHFGSIDSGLFHGGLIFVADQKRRGQQYIKYLESAISNPYIVGCHWFQFRDQPVTGRTLDGENYNIGFVNVCDVPYQELISSARMINYKIYELRYK